MKGLRAMWATAAALTASAVLATPAMAQPPRITERPVVDGVAQAGSTLTARAAWEGDPEPQAGWQWQRCAPAGGNSSCDEIPGATAATYAVTDADVGSRLRVRLTVTNEDGYAWALSGRTAAITAAPSPPPPPGPQPEPGPAPGATPTPEPSPALSPEPSPAPAGGVLDESDRAPRQMRPRPLVRIRGYVTPRGARVTLLSVRAPRGARIVVRCRGRGCPVRRAARTVTRDRRVAPTNAVVTRLARFEGFLRAGIQLTITVTKPGRIGKHTTIRIRRGAGPTRVDRCLLPNRARPVACPSA